MDELRFVRGPRGGIVAYGACAFPDGTQLTIALLGPDDRPLTLTRATVTTGRFQSLPLVPPDGPLPAGRVHVLLSAPFGPGQQNAEVLRRTAEGRDFSGR